MPTTKPFSLIFLNTNPRAGAPASALGEPPTAVINGTKITYSHLTGIVDSSYVLGDVSTAAGTFEFAGSGLVVHKRSSEPFTVTYTIDAQVRPLTQ